jgi:ribosome-associated protein
MPDISRELRFQTARSGGKGGQHVNKVETMVEAYWKVEDSVLFNEEEKQILREVLAGKMNEEGEVMLRCRETRSQAGNKAIVIEKMNELVRKSLIKRKTRKATVPSRQSKEKRLESKKKVSEIKESRRRIRQ